MDVGVDNIQFYIPKYVLTAEELAKARGVDLEKYHKGLGVQKISITPPDEDIITMAANACEKVLKGVEKSKVDMLLFGTESGVDQSKSAGLWIHKLLDLPSRCRVLELKQACYGATAGIQIACAMIKENPESKILVVGSDVARYELSSPGEPTEGAAAVALLITKNPRVMSIEPFQGFYAEDVMDFWRPNYKKEAFVDGKLSLELYTKAILESWKQYQQISGYTINDFDYFGYHTPFPRLAEKTHKILFAENDIELSEDESIRQMEKMLILPRLIGNSYTAALYISLLSLLYNSDENLAGKRVGLYSYGSGCMGEFFSGLILESYKDVLDSQDYLQMVKDRHELSIQQYESFFNFKYPETKGSFHTPHYDEGHYRLEGLKDHIRLYGVVDE